MFLGGWGAWPSTSSPCRFVLGDALLAAAQGVRGAVRLSVVRATFPRYRYDQIMRLGWKVFIPVTLVWIVLIGADAVALHIWN